jgi:hypothetical protein
MNTFRIGWKRGDSLRLLLEVFAEEEPDGSVLRLTRYSAIRLHSAQQELLIPTNASEANRPYSPAVAHESEVRINASDFVRDESDVRLLLLCDGGDVQISFHVPNPLTPRSAGYWIRATIARQGERARILRAKGNRFESQLFWNGKNNWLPRYLVKAGSPSLKPDDVEVGTASLQLDDWFASLEAGFELDLNSANSLEAVGRSALFSPGDATLLFPSKDQQRDADFGLRLAPGSPLRLVCTIEVPGAGDTSGAKVAAEVLAEALGLADDRGVLLRPMWTRRKLSLQCAAISPRGPWTLDWSDVRTDPEQEGPGWLSFRSIWALLSRHVPLGLHTLSARDRLSFLPTEIRRLVRAEDGPESETDPAPWTLRYRIDRGADGAWHARLASIHASPNLASLELGGARSARLPQSIVVDALVEDDPTDTARLLPIAEVGTRFSEDLIRLRLSPLPKSRAAPARSVLVNGVELRLQRLAPAAPDERPSALRLSPRADRRLGDAPIDVDLRLLLESLRPIARGADPERGAEVDGAWLLREPPMVLDLREDSVNDYATRVEILEHALESASHALQINVRAAGDGLPDLQHDVVVLDPAPFTIARVRSRRSSDEGEGDAGQGELLAVYRRDAEAPGSWEFATGTGELDLTLPPQAIGEEMIKADLRIDGSPVPSPTQLFDFRLSPPAQLRLDRTSLETARAPAPWSLRRLLDRRQGEVGLALREAEFELVYGLTTSLRPEDGVRVAGHRSAVGRIPFPSALLAALRDPGELQTYAEQVARWISGLLYHPEQLRTFRDWASREALVFDRDATFRFRTTRQTAHPLRIDEYARDGQIPDDEKTPLPTPDGDRPPLRGGVDFGFESERIYEAVLRNREVDRPSRSQGTVRVTFGFLGGSGRFEALFDEGRTRIIAVVTDGRVDSLTIVRLGRIAMLWNQARHVIVYERSRRTARPYVDTQPQDFEGLAALRKVREYVEITQKRRAYPDGRGNARRTGPLVGAFFETTTIPVRSSWGRDIPEGWIIALAGPVPENVARFYPRPNVFLEFARPPAKGGHVSQRVRSEERLLFFTSTLAGEGSDSDDWAARPDIDFPVAHVPVEHELPYLPALDGSPVQPNALEYEHGLRRFTLDVDVGEEAANLMHGRPVSGLEALVRNVSLARGGWNVSPAASALGKLGAEFGAVEARLADAVAEVSLHVSRLARRAGNVRLREVPELRRASEQLVARAAIQAAAFKVSLRAAGGRLEEAQSTWERLQKDWSGDARLGWHKSVDGEIGESLAQALRDVADRYGANGHVDEARSMLATAYAAAETTLSDRLKRTAFVPARALDQLQGACAAAQRDFPRLLRSFESAARTKIDELARRFPQDAPRALEQELRALVSQRRQEIERAAQSAWRTMQDALGPMFPDTAAASGGGPKLPGPGLALARVIEDHLGGYAESLALVESEAIPPFELGLPSWKALKESLSASEVAESLEHDLDALAQKWVGSFRDLLAPWERRMTEVLEHVRRELEAHRREVEGKLDELRQEADLLRSRLAASIQGLANRLLADAEASQLLGDVKRGLAQLDHLKAIVDPVKTAVKVFEDQVGAPLQRIQNLLAAPETRLDDLLRSAQACVQEVTGGLRNVGGRIESAVVSEVRDKLRGAEEGALDVLRTLAEGPVTDTLRCTREWVGYTYRAAEDALRLTPAAAIFKELGDDALSALSACAPFDRIRDRLLTHLQGFELRRLFPSFAGLRLDHLFPGFKIPSDPTREYDWLDLKHGFDRHRLRAWTELRIDRRFDETLEVFDLGPVSLRVRQPRFRASSRLEAGKGQAVRQRTRGELGADWIIELNGQAILTMGGARLRFDESGDLDFDFRPEDIRLAPALQFLTDALSGLMSSVDGLKVTPVHPGGIRATLSLPIPDVGAGAFTITGITIFSHFELLIANGFELSTGFWLSRPDRPFGIAILFLGGGGWFGVDVRYRPPRVFEARVSVGISAGAMIALNLGIARGSAGVLFTVGLDFYRNWRSRGSGTVVISVGMLIWGEFSILGIASAYLRVVLRIEYRDGAMTGYGRVTIRIKICWCFTLEVDAEVRKEFSAGGSRRSALQDGRADVQQAVRADLQNSDW